MKIKIENTQDCCLKINAIIKKAEGKATARTASFGDVLRMVRDGESALQNINAPKKESIGTRVWLHPECVSNSYRYPADGTFLVVEKGSKHWFLVEAKRVQTGTGKDKKEIEITIPVELQLWMVKGNPLLRDIVVFPKPT